MSRGTKRATAFSLFSRTGPYSTSMYFSARTYLTEVRRFCAVLSQFERDRAGLKTLALEFMQLLGERRFTALLASQGFLTVPRVLTEAAKREVDQPAFNRVIRLRPKICAHALTLLQDRQLLTSTYGILEKMTPRCQTEAVRSMIAAGCFTPSHALHLLSREAPLGFRGRPKKVTVFTPELRELMITEAEILSHRVRAIAIDFAEGQLGLMIARSFTRAVLSNARARAYLAKHHRDRMRTLTIVA